MKALQIYAGPKALTHIAQLGLAPGAVRAIPAAAGGPKGLSLLALDRFMFGEWLPQSTQSIDLVGASIGAWRMAAAMLDEPLKAIDELQTGYIHQEYEFPEGKKMPTSKHVSERFGETIEGMFSEHVESILNHPRYRLHMLTSRGRHILHREAPLRSRLGYGGAYITNLMGRKKMGAWLERAVFSTQATALPFAAIDYRTRRYALSKSNFTMALRASCSIPFVLDAVHDIPGAARGAYWDGGITDYHLHLDYRPICAPHEGERAEGVVLYPHFQKNIVPGWLDKSLKWRHHSTPFLEDVIVLAPKKEWAATLPTGKLPQRSDFKLYGKNTEARVRAWTTAVKESERLADEFAIWLAKGCPAGEVLPL